MNADILILLAVRNGARYLRAQLDSIFLSDFDGRISVLAGLDPSTDGSREVLADYPADGLEYIEHAAPSGSAAGNFSSLLRCALDRRQRYFGLSDQDDVWLSGKLRLGIDKLREMEQAYGASVPLLVFTDAEVVDENLHTIAASFWRHEKLDPGFCHSYKRLALQNVGQGCTFVFNRALLEKLRDIPPEARMHDHWMMLVAALFGHIGYVDAPTLKYRQHGANVLGSEGQGLGHALRRFMYMRQGIRGALLASERQAGALVQRYGAELAPAQRDFFLQFSQLSGRGRLWRKWFCMRHGLRMSSGLRTLGLYLMV
ncbi:hypothetical protein KVP10_06115 [Candidimonas humi]|uniref:Glycosyltransferase n=1 Tax=Candidimonas humi TaxID=683355 RepID=A0ABV8NYY6_9BURK|nr:glycosyltransferase [Candidimonas humi]MBV6304452.1 hypothetical protein [Candidimonas humi]